jgi:hypothetical protein
VTAYQTIVSWKEHDLALSAENQGPFTFLSWSDGSTDPNHSIRLKNSELAITAVFCAEVEGPCSHNLECCSRACFDDLCVRELPPTSLPLTTSPTSTPSSKSSQTNEDLEVLATTIVVLIVVVAVAVVVFAVACVARTIYLKWKKNSIDSPKDVPCNEHHLRVDEEAPLAGKPVLTEDALSTSSNGSKPKDGTVVTQDTALTANNHRSNRQDAVVA